jgi:hypothetical protein
MDEVSSLFICLRMDNQHVEEMKGFVMIRRKYIRAPAATRAKPFGASTVFPLILLP